MSSIIAPASAILEPVQSRVWVNVTIGAPGMREPYALRTAVYAGGFRIGPSVENAIATPDFIIAKEETELNLTVAAVDELGFAGGATRAQIYTKAHELDLVLCPPETSFHVLLQQADRVRALLKSMDFSACLVLAMEPVMCNNMFKVFCIEQECSVLCVHGHYDDEHFIWKPADRFVFCLPPQVK